MADRVPRVDYALFKVGKCFVEPSQGLIIRGDRQLSISPRSMAVLQILMDKKGELVASRVLLEKIWPSNHPGSNTIYKVVNELRAALGDESKQPEYIETFSRKGYRLVADVKPVTPAINSDSVDELFRRGVFQRRRLDVEGLTAAQSYLRAAISLNPDYLPAYDQLAGAILELALFDLRPTRGTELRQEYIGVLSEMEARFPESPLTKEARWGLVRFNQATYPGVESGLRKMFMEDQGFDLFFYRYAELLLSARLPKYAKLFLTEYCRRCPDDPYREILRPGIVRDLGDLNRCIQLRKSLLDVFPNEIGTLAGLVGELTVAGRIAEAKQYLSHLRQADSEGFWYRTVVSTHDAMVGTCNRDENNGDELTNLARGAVAFIRGDIESGDAFWRRLEPELLMNATRYIVGIDYYFPASVKNNQSYKLLLDELGIGESWTQHMLETLRELRPYTGIQLAEGP